MLPSRAVKALIGAALVGSLFVTLASRDAVSTARETARSRAGGSTPLGRLDPAPDPDAAYDHRPYIQSIRTLFHPEALTDCANCHRSGIPDEFELLWIHDYNCTTCHPDPFFTSTILGPIGTFQNQCSDCHRPAVPETGNLATPTKGHRCILCHGEQRSVTDRRDFHRTHAKRANCVVCHGFIPDLGTEIGSGNRNICEVCHPPGQYPNTDSRLFHRKHVVQRLSCLECHADARPPVDVVAGPPVGGSPHVCRVCHDTYSPGDWTGRSAERHRQHTENFLDCGSCHASAQLQDDRDPMPPIDDPVRASVNRTGNNACYLCHPSGRSGNSRKIHERHTGRQHQWCHNCHLPTDGRPSGQQPPVTRPAESCQLCHSNRSYSGPFPYSVHNTHADKNKCYSCHQLQAPVRDWPRAWLAVNCTPLTWYRDRDRDGQGDPLAPMVQCERPPTGVGNNWDCDDAHAAVYSGAAQVCDGLNNDCAHPGWPGLAGTNEFDDDGDGLSECQADCDDANAATYPRAVEVNDGLDNQCPGDEGYGLVDELSGLVVFADPADRTRLSWPPQSGATSYEVIRSQLARFSPGCASFVSVAAFWSDPAAPPAGTAFYYLVRPRAPHAGSWGTDSTGAQRLIVCSGLAD